MAHKLPFDIDAVMRRIRAAVTEHADAAMFELAERGFKSVFQQLVGCIISIRTRDEVSLPTAIKLLERAATPAAVAKLSVPQIDALIRASSFHEAKAAHSARTWPWAWLAGRRGSASTSTCIG